MVTHQNLLHFSFWGKCRFGVMRTDSFLNPGPGYFDNSVFGSYIGLFSGAALVPVDRAFPGKPDGLYDLVQCSVAFHVPDDDESSASQWYRGNRTFKRPEMLRECP
ncbi:MAG: hypothetical protein ACPGXX_00050 [Planctomycetaceae bacterium]